MGEFNSRVPMKCSDKQVGLQCKEAVMLMRAVERFKQSPFDWLAVSQDDKYIWAHNVEMTLAQFDASKPQVYGPFGCARMWEHTEASKGGTVPKPDSYHQPHFHCEDAARK